MREVKTISFHDLGTRELLKPVVWWIGLVAAVATAIVVYCNTNKG